MTSTETAKMQGSLPKSSEAYCALEVGHPQELSLFIYPAGVCHQINIIKCLPVWNKYPARERSTQACCLSCLTEGRLLRCPFYNMGKAVFSWAKGFLPLFFWPSLPFTHSPHPLTSHSQCRQLIHKCPTKGPLKRCATKLYFPQNPSV